MANVSVVVGVGGIGEAIARRIGPGQRLLLADIATDVLDRKAEVMRQDGYDVETQQVDVSSRESVYDLARAASALGPITQVAHTAGLSPSQAESDALLRVDLLGTAFVLDAFAKEIEPGGAGVVIASMAGQLAAETYSHETEHLLATTATDDLLDLECTRPPHVTDTVSAYSLSKRANQIRARAASVVWGAKQARINSISPGATSTPMTQEELASEALGDFIRELLAASAAKRLATPADIAAVAAFLLSPEASYISGSDLLVDGGVTAAHWKSEIEN